MAHYVSLKVESCTEFFNMQNRNQHQGQSRASHGGGKFAIWNRRITLSWNTTPGKLSLMKESLLPK